MTDSEGPSIARQIACDVSRHYGQSSRTRLVRAVLLERTFLPVLTLRLTTAAGGWPGGRLMRPVLAVLHRAACERAGVDLPWRTRIGPGFRLFHGWGAVVNTHAVIGSNVSMFHGVTLGQGDTITGDGTRSTGYPIIEDDVWIGPHAVIVGDVRVGQGSRVGAGAVVIRSVEPHTMVAGNPAVVVRTGVPADVLNPADVGCTR